MCSSPSGVGWGVGSGVAVGGAALRLGPTVGGTDAIAADDADGAAEAPPVLHASTIGASAAVAPTTEIRWSSWRRVIRSSAR